MPRRTEEETNAAGAEAFRGALVGAAKVKPTSTSASATSATHLYKKLFSNLDLADAVTCSVGSHSRWSRRRRLFSVSYLSRVDYTVQSVCSCAVNPTSIFQSRPVLTWTYSLTHRYIQLSGMTFGGWIEADRRLRAYEFYSRREKKRQNDEAVWKRWEGMLEQQERREQEQKQEKG